METFLTRAFAITLCLLTVAAATHAQEPTPTPPPPIIYTGKLIGYFRSPSLQTSGLKGCPSRAQALAVATRDETPSNAAAVVLGTNLPAKAILLGTGDNFSPQLEARTFSPAPSPSTSGAPAGRLPPAQKELYSWYKEGPHWVFYKEVQNYKPLYQRVLNGTNTIPSDNVACYLAAAGYAAVVPGKHDFYFGPERLRQLARFMADGNETGLNPVQMLGANLVIKTSLINPQEVAEDDRKWEWPKKFSLQNVADGSEVYPWLTHTRVKLTEYAPHSQFPVRLRDLLHGEVSTEAELRAALAQIGEPELQADKKALKDLVDDLSKQDVYVCPTGSKGRNDIDIKPGCKLDPAKRRFRVIGDTVVADLGFDLRGANDFVLEADKNYGLVLQSNSPPKTCVEKDVSCIRFHTRFPFFHFNDSKTGDSPDPKRYVYLPEKNVVIFGVVDQSLGEQVGVLNFSWRNTAKENGTIVSVEDPVEALQTQLDFFNRTYPKFNGIKVLLAQMSPEHARKLGGHFPEFQIVISEADGEQSTSELDASTTWSEGPHAKAFVGVPAPYYDPQQRDRYEGIVHLGRVDATYVTTYQREKYERNINKTAAWKLTSLRIEPQEVNIVKPVYARTTGAGPAKNSDDRPLPELSTESDGSNLNGPLKSTFAGNASPGAPPPPTTFFARIDARFKKCQDNDEPKDPYNRIQLLTLCLMREQLSADVALIQKRDFFNELPATTLANPVHFQEALDRIIWKGDLLSLLYVPGSALKNVLEQSKKFDGEDGNALSLADERARGLQFIGVRFDSKSKKYIINELPLDDNKIYAVATTDYVSAGDTGYPDLSDKALNPKNRADKFPRELIPISSLVCRGLFANPQAALPYCTFDLETQKYLDETNAKADPAGLSLGFGTKVAAFFKPTKQSWSTPFTLDDNVQRRPIWVLSLKSLSFTVSSLSHNLSDEDLGKKFGGVPASGVTANKTYTIAESSDIRFSRFSHDWEFFIGSKVDYKVQSTGDEDPKVDQLENRVTPEAGIVRNLLGGRGQSRLGATFTFHTEVPLAKPFTVFKLSGDDQLKITQPRRVLILPRLGLRWQNDTNYFEGGGQIGREYKALAGYRFDTTSEVCLPNAAETFGDCISRLNKTTPPSITKDTGATPIVNSRNRIGLYWKSAFSIPIWSKIKYEFTDEGNFFFNSHGDNVSDTRLWDNQKHGLKIAVFSSLSIGPSYQMIFFRNKINRDFLFQKQFGIETTFAFDLFNRRERKVQVMHKP